MQANLETATTDRQALENSKDETARTHAAALEQLKQSITSTKERLEEAQSSVAALQAELQVAPPPSRCRPSDPNSHWQLCRRARQAKIRPRSSISLRRRPWKRLARTSHNCRQISMSVPAHGRLYWRSPHLAFVLAPACIVARVTAWSCTDGQDQCREREGSQSRRPSSQA